MIAGSIVDDAPASAVGGEGRVRSEPALDITDLSSGESAAAERAYATDSLWLGWLKHDRLFDPLRAVSPTTGRET